ncbi:hypothetical protein E4T56_gene11340 [Termitomyces sp. T112]|nr:hypothetical protein E4T56_gene11340 [Termitomyces sp. T112]
MDRLVAPLNIPLLTVILENILVESNVVVFVTAPLKRVHVVFNSSLANVLPQEAPLSSAIRQSTIASIDLDDNLADTSFTSHKPLRRSTRIGAGLVQGGQLQTTNGLNEAHTHAPDLISQIPSPKRTHVPARRSQASSPSFSSQSRYFELDLSPIIESPATMAPLAPSAVIIGEGEDMLAYSLTGDVSPDSSSNLEDMVLPPNRTKRSEGSKETARSEARNVVIIKRDLHPKTLVTVPGDLSNQNNDSLDIRSRKEHIPSAAIPAVVLTVPTPDLPNQSRDVKVSSGMVRRSRQINGRNLEGSGPTPPLISGPMGLGFTVDTLGALPHSAGDGSDEGFIEHSYTQPRPRTLGSQANNVLFRRSVYSIDRGRRAWDTVLGFFSRRRSLPAGLGSVAGDVSTSVNSGRRRGLDLSFSSTSSRWFGT